MAELWPQTYWNRIFFTTAPNQNGSAISICLWNGDAWLHLAVAPDLFLRMVVGWGMDKRIKAALVCDALQMALWLRRMPKGVIVHSDRGSRYCSKRSIRPSWQSTV